MNVFLSLFAAFNYLSFIAAALFFFRTKEKPTRLVHVLKACALASAVLQVGFLYSLESLTLTRAGIATLCFSASIILFFTTLRFAGKRQLSEIFSSDAPKILFHQGPYRFVRHPFYLSYLLSYCGGWIATGSMVVAIQTLVMFALYTLAARYEESKFAHSELAGQYRDYSRTVPRFVPRPSFRRSARKSAQR